jgi:hypothetical protein
VFAGWDGVAGRAVVCDCAEAEDGVVCLREVR